LIQGGKCLHIKLYMLKNDDSPTEVAKSSKVMGTLKKTRTSFSTREEVAEALGVALETVSRWTTAKKIPSIRLGRLVRYDLEAVAAHLVKQAKNEKR
jgi:excisionase family DNA binding protein